LIVIPAHSAICIVVIPAYAGIHAAQWIPAFAGMTGGTE
jgi:hypothetical protein